MLETADLKIRLAVVVHCDDKPCGKITNNYDGKGGGAYTVQDLPQGEVKIWIDDKVGWLLGPKISIKSNELRVNIQKGKRVVVLAALTSGSESYYGSNLATATHTYMLLNIPEKMALPMLQGLKQPAKL